MGFGDRWGSNSGRGAAGRQMKGRCAPGGVGSGTEFLAAQYLSERGYTIRRRNYAARGGEIDIIAEKDGVVAFVEVRFRQSTRFGTPAETVTLAKRRRITRTALNFMAENRASLEGRAFRFDVISMSMEDGRLVFEHFRNAFEAWT